MLYYSEIMLDEDDLQLDAELHFSTMTAYTTEEYSTKELSQCILIVSNYRKKFCKSEELLFFLLFLLYGKSISILYYMPAQYKYISVGSGMKIMKHEGS